MGIYKPISIYGKVYTWLKKQRILLHYIQNDVQTVSEAKNPYNVNELARNSPCSRLWGVNVYL